MIDQIRQDVIPSGIQSVTSEEARDKICVMSDTSSCVADRCMAWRKDYSYIKTVKYGVTRLAPQSIHQVKVDNGKGYCGMVIHKGD